MLISDIDHTCGACPSAWEFTTDHGWKGYVRYRWGKLRVDITRTPEEDPITILSEQIGDSFAGLLDWEEVEPRIVSLDVANEVERAIREGDEHDRRIRDDKEYRLGYYRQWAIDVVEACLDYNHMTDVSMERALDQKARGLARKIWRSRIPEPDEAKIAEYVKDAEEQYQASLSGATE